ncbi:hypothetical protein [Streptomyces sp. NBC_01268]|uniref:hypothetical protein n=1 Tax=Streptomyces sp. NBC_01268 TaxID=2903806 RepID=UPI002E31F670|nr:hypothetical protein [Streptomyces sp. NBC_01268]
MNTKRIAAAEGVILAALKTRKTAAGVAVALESACLLQSPESVAETAEMRSSLRRLDQVAMARGREVNRLLARVSELEAERHSTNEALSDAAEALRVQRDRIAELEGAAAEQTDAIVRWLLKKAREYGSTRNRQHAAQAEVLERMADKISRGAVRPAPFVPTWPPQAEPAKPHPTAGELAEQRHLVDPLDHALEALAPRTTDPRVLARANRPASQYLRSSTGVLHLRRSGPEDDGFSYHYARCGWHTELGREAVPLVVGEDPRVCSRCEVIEP